MNVNPRYLPFSRATVPLVLTAVCSLVLSAARAQESAKKPSADAAKPREFQVFRLKSANAADLAPQLQNLLGSTAHFVADPHTNSLLISAANTEQLTMIKDILNRLDVEAGKERHGLTVFQLKSVEPNNSLAEALALAVRAGGADGNYALDPQRRLVILSADANTTKTVEALLNRLEEGAPRQADQDRQVRLVWLVNGLADKDAVAPPEDLKDVLPRLAKLGIDRPRFAGQILVSVAASAREFHASGVAKLDSPCPFSVVGRFIDKKQTPVLELSIKAHRIKDEKLKEEICNLQTEISAPPAHTVVLGMTPTESATSVFLVQVLRGEPKEPRPRQ